MAEISNLGYAVFGVSALDPWARFAEDVIGWQLGRHVPGKSLALRMDELEQRILLTQTGENDLVALGWEFDTEDELEAYVEHLRSVGANPAPGSAELAESRRVRKLYTCTDPSGVQHEFYFVATLTPMANAFRSRTLQGGFRTGRLGAGHAVIVAQDYEQSVAFYQQTMKLRLSDYVAAPLPGTPVTFNATFFHTKTGRQHSLATAAMPVPKRMHHFMVEVTDLNDVGLAYDRCLDAGVSILSGLGRHPNDQMLSFYCQTPSGFGLEVGWGGIVVKDDWEVRTYSHISDWGHKPVHAALI